MPTTDTWNLTPERCDKTERVDHFRRIGALRRKLTRAGLPGLLVTYLPDLRYLSGFTMLSAFQNVADTLYAIRCDADALKAAVAAEGAAAKSLAIARTQLELGDVSYLALLNAEQTYQQAVMSRVQALANRYADTAALFQALGGGWWNRSGVPWARE